MRVLCWMLLLGAAAVSCRSGTVDMVSVENPAVKAEAVTPRPTPTAPPPPVSAQATTTEAPGADGATADDVTADDVDESAQTPSNGADDSPITIVDAAAAADTDAVTETDTGETDTGETDAGADAVTETQAGDTDFSVIDVGVNPVADQDDWCTVAAKLDDNYQAVNAVDRTNPAELEAVFRQTYDSIERAAQIAPGEIAADVEVERWVWDQVVAIHADANWNSPAVRIDQVVELSERNLGPLQAVDDYTAQICG